MPSHPNPEAPQQAEAPHPSLLQNTVLLPPRSLPPPTLECERRSPPPVRLPAHRSMHPGRPQACDLLSCPSQENRNKPQHPRLCAGRPDGNGHKHGGANLTSKSAMNWKFTGNNKKTQPGGTRMNTDWTDFHGFEIRVHPCHP